MKKKSIFITILLVLGLLLLGFYALGRRSNNNKEIGEGPIKCYIEGELLTDKYGNDIVICEEEAALQNDKDRFYHVKAVDGKFYLTINTENTIKYVAFLYNQYLMGYWTPMTFLAENGHVKIRIMGADEINFDIHSDGEEWQMYKVKDSIEQVRFNNTIDSLNKQLYDKVREKDYFKADYISWLKETDKWLNGNEPSQALQDSLDKIRDYYAKYRNEQFTDAGLSLKQLIDSIEIERTAFCCNYYAEHPMVWALYDVVDAADRIAIDDRHGLYFGKAREKDWPFLTLYHEKLAKLYPGHPIHEKIALAEEGCKLIPGISYIDYTVRDADDQPVSISSLIKDRVALIDLWASWCASCRRHSKAIIPIYEKYKDKGFTVVAIAREKNRENMEQAIKQDGYPWTSYFEPFDDENHIWSMNGATNAGGAMILVDRDGTILSTSTYAEELEQLIKKALDIN